MDSNFNKSNTNNMLCLPSESKINKINDLTRALLFKKASLIEGNYIIKFYKECNSDVCYEDVLTKIKSIIKINEIQKAVNLKDKTGKTSLSNLSDSEISAFYGNPVLDLKGKQYLKCEVNCHIMNAFKNDYFNSDVSKELLDRGNKIPSYLHKKKNILELLNKLELKVNMSQNQLTTIEHNLQQLSTIRKNNEAIKNDHNIHIMYEAQDVTLKARMLQIKGENHMIHDYSDILKAIDILKHELEKYVFADILKLRETTAILEEFNKIIHNKEFQELLKMCQNIQKFITKNNDFFEVL